MIQIDMEMPDCCGNCPCFHFENPMYCRARTDVHQRVTAPYRSPRPEWCPLKEVPETNVGKWISVNDRMPENELMVIGYTPVDGYMFIGFHRTHVSQDYDWSDWYIITAMRSTKKITKKVTHWMPLPEPPKEET